MHICSARRSVTWFDLPALHACVLRGIRSSICTEQTSASDAGEIVHVAANWFLTFIFAATSACLRGDSYETLREKSSIVRWWNLPCNTPLLRPLAPSHFE